ncbi:MAG TPA: hypothetical protein VG755_09850 [Nannocystaceae bacterium]|nr:hypothetical protein [Nannocystaceae bacterium]
MRAIWLATSLAGAGCFAAPPSVDADDDSGGESSSSSDTGDALACTPELPPEGCADMLANGGLDDWADALPLPHAWVVGDGIGARTDGEADACAPALEIAAGAPRSDGVVWELGQDFVDVTLAPGGRATFLARIDLVAGDVGDLRICYNADPASICEDVFGFTSDGWLTVMAETIAMEGQITLKDFGLSSKMPGQVVHVDDLRLLACP